MVDGFYSVSRPTLQFIREGAAGGDSATCPAHGLPGKDSSQLRVEPHAVLTTAAEIAIEVRRGIERIAAQQDLRHRRLPQRKVSRGNEQVGAAAADQLGQLALFKPEPSRGSGRHVKIRHADVRKVLKLTS